MDDTKLRFGVGVLVLSAIGVGVILTFLFGAFPTVLARTYSLTVDIDSAAGISNNTPVLRDGVRIGRVSQIQLRPEGGVQLTLAIDSDRKLTRAYVPKIGSSSLVTGDAKLEFRKDLAVALENLDGQAPAGAAPVPPNMRWDAPEEELLASYYADGDYIRSNHTSDDPLSAIANLEDDVRKTLVAVQRAGAALENAGSSVNELATSVRGIVTDNEVNIRDIAGKANEALNEFQLAMSDIRSVAGNPELRAKLIESLDSLPRVLDEAEQALANTKNTMKQFERVGIAAEEAVTNAGATFQSIDRTVVNLEKFTEPLGERGEEIVEQVMSTFANLDQTLQQITQFGDLVNNSNGSLRRLIEDDEIYFQVKRTLGNIEHATVRIRPILDDVRVFTDKLARDPSQLGVKGALTARPAGVGLK
jgi:phospholipid/cholesterol/gamma-HCH transport system substrate-binding protein